MAERDFILKADALAMLLAADAFDLASDLASPRVEQLQRLRLLNAGRRPTKDGAALIEQVVKQANMDLDLMIGRETT